MSVSNLVRLAGTSRSTFYELFSSGEACIAHAIGVAGEEIFAPVEAQDGTGEWSLEAQDAIAGVYAAVAADPVLAELCLIHSHASRVERGLSVAEPGVECLTRLLRRGRAEAAARGRPPLPDTAEEFFAVAIIWPALRRVRSPEVEALPGEAHGVARLVVDAYLGSDTADRLISEPAHS